MPSTKEIGISPTKSWKSDNKLFKWALFGVFVAGTSYWLVKKYRIAYCQEYGNCDPGKDPLDKLVERVKINTDSIINDIKQKVDEISAEAWTNIHESILDDKTKEAFDVILSILDRLKEFDMPEIAYKLPIPLLLALTRRIQEHESTINNDKMTEVQMSINEFEDAKRMAQFALNVYPSSWSWLGDPQDTTKVAQKMGLTDQDQVLFTWFDNTVGDTCPNFIIFTDEQSKSIVLAIRGTFSLADVVVDIICDQVPYLDGFAHRGILSGANRIMTEGKETLKKAFEEHPDYRLVITGHSLGAGTAILISLGFLDNIYANDFPNVKEVKCIALAPPPVYRTEKPLPAKIQNDIKIFINQNDCVPRLSLANMAKLIAMARAIDDELSNMSLEIKDYLKILAVVDEEKVNDIIKKLSAVTSKVNQDQFPTLDHIGQVYYLTKPKHELGKFQIMNPPGQFFSRSLLLFDNMILHHLQPYYEEAFANVDLKDFK